MNNALKMAENRQRHLKKSAKPIKLEQLFILNRIQPFFQQLTYNFETLCERLRESAFLLKGLKIEIIDERNDLQEVFHYENGIEAFVAYLNEDKDVLHPVVSFEGESRWH